MIILIKIAFRNILSNRKRSFLIGIVIFFSTLLLVVLDSSMNGMEIQVLKRFVNIQSGDVAVVWENLKKVSNQNMSRLSTFGSDKSFDVDKNPENINSIALINNYIKDHKKEIRYFFPAISRAAKISSAGKIDNIIIYGLTGKNGEFLIDTGTLKIDKGALFPDMDYSICISRAKADYCGADIGDPVMIEALTPYGAKNLLEFQVTGIYDNGFGWNTYAFISADNARELFDFDPGYFDIGRIYLNDPDTYQTYADNLDSHLLKSSRVLRAESFAEASAIAAESTGIMKLYFNIFILFILVMIAIGLRVTIKMNLFERMKEFGTIRAIGFSEMQSYAIIFLEIFFLSMICLLTAFIIGGIFVLISGSTGIYVGSEASSFLGGDKFYPVMKYMDIFFIVMIMIVFSLVSTFSPGVKICCQGITDLLLKKQRKLFLTGILFKKLIRVISFKFSGKEI